MSTSPLIVKVGESSSAYLKRNQLDSKRNVDRQPAGLNFYEKHWPTRAPGSVRVEHGPYSFDIARALTTTGTEDLDYPEDGISSFYINASLTTKKTLSHDEARLRFMALLEDLVNRGWKAYIHHAHPRLTGKDSFTYIKQDDIYSPSPSYVPTLEEWMSLRTRYSWNLYAEDVFLKVTFTRDSSRMNPEEDGAYLISFNLDSKREHACSHFEGEERAQWSELWVEKIKQLKRTRYTLEDKLEQGGFSIYTDYVEPKVHPADPVEP